MITSSTSNAAEDVAWDLRSFRPGLDKRNRHRERIAMIAEV